MSHLYTSLAQPNKGFILGTINNSNQVSISLTPRVHATHRQALDEASRLLNSRTISTDKTIVVLQVMNYVKLDPNPIKVL